MTAETATEAGERGSPQPDRGKESLAGHAAALFAGITWGASFVAARAVLHGSPVSLSPTVLAALRFSIASLFLLLPLGLAVGRRRLAPRDLLKLAVLGQISFALYFWLQYTGVQKTNAGIASILVVGLVPLSSTLLAGRMSDERAGPLRYAALLLGLAGTAVIVLQQPVSVSLRSGFLLGALCLVSNALLFAAYSNISKRWVRNIRPVVLTGGTMVSGAMGLVLLSLADPRGNRWPSVVQLSPGQWVAVLYLGLACSLAAFFAYNFALTRIDVSQASAYVYVEPPTAVALGALLLGESISWQTVVGAGLIAVSVAALSMRPLTPLPPSPSRGEGERGERRSPEMATSEPTGAAIHQDIVSETSPLPLRE